MIDMMDDAIPSLIRSLRHYQRVPYPEDVGIDTLVKTVFSKERVLNDTFSSSNVHHLGYKMLVDPEKDKQAILSRQEVLKYFLDNKGLVKLILSAEIPDVKSSDHWNHKFDNYLERTRAYHDLVKQLNKEMPSSSNPEIKAFRNRFINLENHSEFKRLGNILDDIEAPSQLIMNTKFASIDSERAYNQYKVYNKDVKVILGKSGEKIPFDNSKQGIEDPKFPYNHIMGQTVKQVKQKTRKNLEIFKTKTTIDFKFDEALEKINCKATYNKLRLLPTIFSLRKKTKPIEVNIDLNYEDSKWPYYATGLKSVIKKAKYDFFEEDLYKYNQQIYFLGDAVCELRYLTALADYFNYLNKKRVELTFPKIAEAECNITRIKGLAEPNLIMKKMPKGRVVRNNVNADPKNNVYVITGPNNNGKTTYLNSIALAQVMTQAGWMIPAKQAEISPKDNVFTHYIRPGDLAVGESRFAHELSRIKTILEQATPYSLILFDEPCSGTSPQDGKKVADGMLRAVWKLGATTYVATHYHNLISTAQELPFADNLYCAAHQRNSNLRYTYKIKQGSSDKSNGIYLAKRMKADYTGLVKTLEERAQEGELSLR